MGYLWSMFGGELDSRPEGRERVSDPSECLVHRRKVPRCLDVCQCDMVGREQETLLAADDSEDSGEHSFIERYAGDVHDAGRNSEK